MKLLTAKQERQLMMHGIWNAGVALEGGVAKDFEPVVRLYCSWDTASWLLSEIAPDDGDMAFGLLDPSRSIPFLGSVRLSWLRSLRGPNGEKVSRDRAFKARMTLSAYRNLAVSSGRIIP